MSSTATPPTLSRITLPFFHYLTISRITSPFLVLPYPFFITLSPFLALPYQFLHYLTLSCITIPFFHYPPTLSRITSPFLALPYPFFITLSPFLSSLYPLTHYSSFLSSHKTIFSFIFHPSFLLQRRLRHRGHAFTLPHCQC